MSYRACMHAGVCVHAAHMRVCVHAAHMHIVQGSVHVRVCPCVSSHACSCMCACVQAMNACVRGCVCSLGVQGNWVAGDVYLGCENEL